MCRNPPRTALLEYIVHQRITSMSFSVDDPSTLHDEDRRIANNLPSDQQLVNLPSDVKWSFRTTLSAVKSHGLLWFPSWSVLNIYATHNMLSATTLQAVRGHHCFPNGRNGFLYIASNTLAQCLSGMEKWKLFTRRAMLYGLDPWQALEMLMFIIDRKGHYRWLRLSAAWTPTITCHSGIYPAWLWKRWLIRWNMQSIQLWRERPLLLHAILPVISEAAVGSLYALVRLFV